MFQRGRYWGVCKTKRPAHQRFIRRIRVQDLPNEGSERPRFAKRIKPLIGKICQTKRTKLLTEL